MGNTNWINFKLNIENLLDSVIELGNKEFITKGDFNVGFIKCPCHG